ncbi:hypothetical protein [Rhodococcus sp. ARC_M6]|uniref:hypothetical protein n=1 Tax=Rhodococcus sp. ARC_M6 TaxID=2928852 RepID=UPI001FB367E9|nr:hypothetical protein [Rhodococcus sp. ARC_M6]MCJ0905299.1 hypothetical protein [Rhodococcus sp. ARC_M6]
MTETVIEVSVVSPRAALWPALIDPTLIRRWHGWDCAELDDEIEYIYSTAEADPDAFTLTLGNGDQFSLIENDGTTIVRITRPPRRPDDEWFADVTEGWTTFLHFLKFGVEHHGLAERRTIYLDGPLRPGETAASVLGLDSVAAVPGTRYNATLAPGDYAEGVVDYVSDLQTGVTIEDLGPGLLVCATQPAGPHRPQPGLQILLATYNLSDDEFSEIEHHWKQWWDGRTRAI